MLNLCMGDNSERRSKFYKTVYLRVTTYWVPYYRRWGILDENLDGVEATAECIKFPSAMNIAATVRKSDARTIDCVVTICECYN